MDGELTVFSDQTGKSNGLYIDAAGNIIGCADEKGQVVSFDPDAKMKVMMEGRTGKRLNGPNDLWIDHLGGIYLLIPITKEITGKSLSLKKISRSFRNTYRR
ncbi:hypothetical protein BH20BAC1_BH20BAC1_13780 [soil metagenome]